MDNIIQLKGDLERARAILKEEFVGIDDQIDDVIELVHSWYCFPEGQIRPTVINLVGMTGVGKTSLIERLFEVLGLVNSFYKFDMGYYANNAENLKYELSKKVRSFDGHPICFVLDEFQLCRSISDEGAEIDRGNFRPIWDLLDHGRIVLMEQNYGVDMLYTLIIKLEHCVANGVEAKGLSITKNDRFFLEVFGKEAYDDDEDEKKDDKLKVPSFVPDRYYYYLQECLPGRFISDDELKRHLRSLKDHKATIEFLQEAVNSGGRPKTYDFSNSIIFVIANVDEAYVDAKDADPDMDADMLHEHSMNITLFDLKHSLSKRFRTEQIARLGNNYVIYPAFSSETYRKLITLELGRKSEIIKSKFNIDVEFDKSIHKIIYNEGVFPTHGSRPVFTTVNYIVGSFVGRILGMIKENGWTERVSTIQWKFKNGKNHIFFFEKGAETHFSSVSYKVNIKVDSLRKPKNNDEQAQVSVHEAGHAIVSAVLLGQVPKKVISSSAGAAEGFNLITWKKLYGEQYAMHMASVYLGGIEAEKIVFGQAYTTSYGAKSDIETVTELISSMVNDSGLYFPWRYHSNPELGGTDMVLDVQRKSVEKFEEIMRAARNKAKEVLERNKQALMDLSLELFRSPVLYKKKVLEILERNNVSIKADDDGFYKNVLLEFEKQQEQKRLVESA